MNIPQLPSDDTLASNTGYDSQNRSKLIPSKYSCKVDWLDFTLRNVAGPIEAYELVNCLEISLCRNLHFCANHAAFNGITWDGSGRSEDGVLTWYKAPTVDDCGEYVAGSLKFAFPGDALTPLISERLLTFFAEMGDDHPIDCTRIDIALDDHEKFIKLGKIEHARRGGHFFNCSHSERISSKRRGEDEAVTIYFGSRKSDKRLRIYDKTLESKGKVFGNRWEAQFRRKAAGEAFRFWCTEWKFSPSTVSNALARLVLGIIDFRKRGDDDDDRHRCEPLPWFSALIKAVDAEPMRIVVQPEEKTMQRSINWVNRSVASTLAMIKISLADEFLPYIERMVTEGGAKLSNMRREVAYLTGQHELLY